MEEKGNLNVYAIIAQPTNSQNKYSWEKWGKYKRLKDAEMALRDLTSKKYYSDFVFKIVPYFREHWWTDEDVKKKEYQKANSILWDFLESKGMSDEARQFLKKHF